MLTFLRAARRLRRPSPRTTIALVVAVGLITGAAVATPRLAADRTAIRASNADFSPAVYVNMGDSLSSGEGTYPPYDPGTNAPGKNMCHRSPESYGEQFASFMNNDFDYTNVACSGAGTNEIGAADAPASAGGVPKNTGGNPDTGEPAQVAALGSSTRLVTISIGINDVGLISDYAQACYKSANLAAEDQCFRHLTDPASSILAANLSLPYTDGSYESALFDLSSELNSAYTEIRQQAPNATVAVLTYPQIYPATYTGPCQTFGLPWNSRSLVTSQAMLDAVHTVVSQLNAVIAGEVAQFPGFILVDESNALAGHDVCASDRWVNQINGITINGSADDESLHPTSDGYAAMADVLERRLYPGRYSTGAYEGPIGSAYDQDGGPQELGFPADTGAGPYVHFWEPVNAEAEDFSGGAVGPALMVEGPKGTFYVNLGFRATYLSGANAQACGAPTDLAYASAGGTRQDFVSCYMTWTSSGGVVVHPAAANPAANPAT